MSVPGGAVIVARDREPRRTVPGRKMLLLIKPRMPRPFGLHVRAIPIPRDMRSSNAVVLKFRRSPWQLAT
jgi:hypothetical protein